MFLYVRVLFPVSCLSFLFSAFTYGFYNASSFLLIMLARCRRTRQGSNKRKGIVPAPLMELDSADPGSGPVLDHYQLVYQDQMRKPNSKFGLGAARWGLGITPHTPPGLNGRSRHTYVRGHNGRFEFCKAHHSPRAS